MRRQHPQPTERQRRQAEILGICATTIRTRLHRGWRPEAACKTPARERLPDGQRSIYNYRYSRSGRAAHFLMQHAQDLAVEKLLARHDLAD